CGGFVLFFSEPAEGRLAPHIAYHFGRLLTYATLGAIAGFIGSAVDVSGALVGVQRLSAWLVGGLLIYWGLRSFFSGALVEPLRPGILGSVGGKILRYVLKRPSRTSPDGRVSAWTGRAFFLGLASGVLPCGWLWMFVALAAGTANALGGASVMAVFWIGTVPILAALGLASRLLTAPARKLVPRITGALLILSGLFSLSGHVGLVTLHDHSHHRQGSADTPPAATSPDSPHAHHHP
ncbi:MAG: sulfite exporter TauE/SafE family protein, partial [Bdellovibrionales bacterium]|nr:sulfite exporter TauE/SafE family protein [Bdellovibrionales bacterium]